MSPTTEAIVVGVMVTVAGAWAVRAIWRSVRSEKSCSSCSSSGDCPLMGEQKKTSKLTQLDHCGPSKFDCSDYQKKSDKT